MERGKSLKFFQATDRVLSRAISSQFKPLSMDFRNLSPYDSGKQSTRSSFVPKKHFSGLKSQAKLKFLPKQRVRHKTSSVSKLPKQGTPQISEKPHTTKHKPSQSIKLTPVPSIITKEINQLQNTYTKCKHFTKKLEAALKSGKHEKLTALCLELQELIELDFPINKGPTPRQLITQRHSITSIPEALNSIKSKFIQFIRNTNDNIN